MYIPGKIKIAVLLLVFPAMVVGHDVYYWDKSNFDFAIFRLSEIGWMFTYYIPDIYDSMVDLAGEGVWKEYVIPFLDTKTVIVASIPAAIVFVFGLFDWAKYVVEMMQSPKTNNSALKGRTFSADAKGKFFSKESTKKK